MNILVNGKQTDSLAVADRAVQYGDGLLETVTKLTRNDLLALYQKLHPRDGVVVVTTYGDPICYEVPFSLRLCTAWLREETRWR